MGAIPEKSFSVRTPAWWDTNSDYVLGYYPGRPEAERRSGHDFTIVQRPVEVVGFKRNHVAEGYKALVRSGSGAILHIAKQTYEVIENSVMYDFAEALLDQGFCYETGGTMGEGAICYLTLLLNEPVVITGDTSTTLPYAGLSWSHNGTIANSVRSTSVRQVCQNTVSASEAEGKRLGTNFTFKHTKNVMTRINEAREAIKGVRANHGVYVKAMEELASIPVTPEQRDLFVSTIIGDERGKDGVPMSLRADTSARVKTNIENERAKVNGIFFSQTMPEAHALTGYGLHLAGVEYFDHLRAHRSQDSYVKRTLLTDNPAKANLNRTIREVVAA